MKVAATEAVTNIAGAIPAARDLFEKFGIDYASAGARSLADAAYEEGVDLELLLASIRRIADGQKPEPWNERPLADVVRHLADEHRRVVRDELEPVAFGLFDLCAPPAKPDPDLLSLRAGIRRLSATLLPHFADEESSVFPLIEALESPLQSARGDVDRELRTRIRNIVAGHGVLAAQLRTIRQLRVKLEVSNDLQPRCRSLLAIVAKLEAHLHETMFLENGCLFPRAVALQEQTPAA